jgi:hypothetical protein
MYIEVEIAMTTTYAYSIPFNMFLHFVTLLSNVYAFVTQGAANLLQIALAKFSLTL